MVKSVRTWNANEQVNAVIEEEKVGGKGFSAWTNKMILKGVMADKNNLSEVPPKSELKELKIKI